MYMRSQFDPQVLNSLRKPLEDDQFAVSMALLRIVGRSNGRAPGNGRFGGDQEVDLPLPPTNAN
jgi:hypothetical protein